ncbi:MAG: restriction endonuclease subunit S [Candidatus Aenigmatarchaeota archaeon]
MKFYWQTKKLGEINGKFEKEKVAKGTTPYVEISNVDVISKKITFTNKGAVENSVFAPADSILISRVRPTRGAVAFVKEKIAVSSAFTIIKPKPEYNPRLIFYFLAWNKKFFDYLGSKQKGTNYPSVKEGDILDFEICIPTEISIQHKIVSILDTIQKAVEIQDRIIEKTKELKKSLMADLFKYGGPSFRKGRKLKKTEIGEIPEDWEVVRLGEENISEIIMGQSPSSQYYNEKGMGLPFLQGKAEFGDITPLPTKWCTRPIRISKEGDILISVRAPVGDVNFADQVFCIGRGLAAIRCKNNLNKIFLFNYLKFAKKRLIEEASGSTFKAIRKSNIENFKIPLPSLPEQQEIADILSTIDQKIEIEEKKKRLYEELFKTVLNKIMNQEIDVEDIEI